MKPGFISVPFKASKDDGLSEINGIAKFSSAGIIIEFEKKFLGLFGSEIKEVRIGLEDIQEITFRKGIWRFFSKIQIRLRSMANLKDLPNSGGKLKLSMKREDFETAQSAVFLMNGQNQYEPEEIGAGHTSVAELFEAPENKYKTNDLKETKKLK